MALGRGQEKCAVMFIIIVAIMVSVAFIMLDLGKQAGAIGVWTGKWKCEVQGESYKCGLNRNLELQSKNSNLE